MKKNNSDLYNDVWATINVCVYNHLLTTADKVINKKTSPDVANDVLNKLSRKTFWAYRVSILSLNSGSKAIVRRAVENSL